MKNKLRLTMIACLSIFISVLSSCIMINWSQWKVTIAPTCLEKGEETRFDMSNNSKLETRVLLPLGHDWGNWYETQTPTFMEEGEETRVCKRDSSHIETRILDKLNNEQGTVVTEAGLWLTKQESKYKVVAYSGSNKTVVIPAYYNDIPITSIISGIIIIPLWEDWVTPGWEKYMFSNNKNITTIQFEKGSNIEKIEDYAFSNCTNLINFEIPSSLKYIGDNAFYNTGIWNNTLDNNVVYVDSWVVGYKGEISDVNIKSNTIGIASLAFYNSSITSIKIPNSVKVINSYAFYDSQLINNVSGDNIIYADNWVIGYQGTLTTMTFKNETVGIADSSFNYNNNIVNITIPASVESIGYDAFSSCRYLANVNLKDGLKNIGNYAFAYCNQLNNINIPSSVVEIGEFAFNSCHALTNITLSPNITKINDSTFSNCELLANITIPSKVTNIGSFAFSHCALKNVTISKNITFIDISAFGNNIKMESIIVEDGNIFYKSDGNCLIEISSKTLIAGFKNTIIPTDVVCIGESAFRGIPIKNIVIPDSVLVIKDFAFDNCKELTSIKLGKGLIKIGDYAFINCIFLTNIILSNNLLEIGAYAFSSSNLKTIVIPDSVKHLNYGAFYGCKSLETATIGKGVVLNSEDSSIFADCESLTSITIPSNVKNISPSMFSYCIALTTVIIENGIVAIGNYAFNYCSNLKSINIPATVINIGHNAFIYLTKLENITVENKNNIYKSEGNCLIEKASGTLLVGCKNSAIPNYILIIDEYAFAYCSIANITIPSLVTTIKYGAFMRCVALINVFIPKSVNVIEDFAFYDCSQITIYCEAKSKPDGWNYNWNYSMCPVIWEYKK